jgi:hypothetical protein
MKIKKVTNNYTLPEMNLNGNWKNKTYLMYLPIESESKINSLQIVSN